MTGLFSHSVGNVIIPIDELICFRGIGIPPTSEVLGFHPSGGSVDDLRWVSIRFHDVKSTASLNVGAGQWRLRKTVQKIALQSWVVT